jgi:hypothetical protein
MPYLDRNNRLTTPTETERALSAGDGCHIDRTLLDVLSHYDALRSLLAEMRTEVEYRSPTSMALTSLIERVSALEPRLTLVVASLAATST